MDEDTIVSVSEAVSECGWTCVRFNFPYRQECREFNRQVDVPEAEDAMVALCKAFTARGVVVLGGKSFGARIALQVMDRVDSLVGLCFLGFPLRPPNQAATEERLIKLLGLALPKLYVEGTADPFMPPGDLERIESESEAATVVRIAGGDHSFRIGDESGASPATLKAISVAVASFLSCV